MGPPLMRKAFQVEDKNASPPKLAGPLTDANTVVAEQQALSDLAAGANGVLQEPAQSPDGRTDGPDRRSGNDHASKSFAPDRGRPEALTAREDCLDLRPFDVMPASARRRRHRAR